MKFFLSIALPCCIMVQQATSYQNLTPQCWNDGEVRPDIRLPWVFYRCERGSWIKQCPDNMTYDPQSRECLVKQDTSYQSPTPQCWNDGEVLPDIHRPWVSYRCERGSWIQQCLDNMTYDPQSGQCLLFCSPPPGRCTDGEYRADPCNCHLFYHCSHGSFGTLECAPGTGFDSNLNVCAHEKNVPLCQMLGQVKANFA